MESVDPPKAQTNQANPEQVQVSRADFFTRYFANSTPDIEREYTFCYICGPDLEDQPSDGTGPNQKPQGTAPHSIAVDKDTNNRVVVMCWGSDHRRCFHCLHLSCLLNEKQADTYSLTCNLGDCEGRAGRRIKACFILGFPQDDNLKSVVRQELDKLQATQDSKKFLNKRSSPESQYSQLSDRDHARLSEAGRKSALDEFQHFDFEKSSGSKQGAGGNQIILNNLHPVLGNNLQDQQQQDDIEDDADSQINRGFPLAAESPHATASASSFRKDYEHSVRQKAQPDDRSRILEEDLELAADSSKNGGTTNSPGADNHSAHGGPAENAQKAITPEAGDSPDFNAPENH